MIRAMAVLLRDWPQFNARYMDEQGYVSRFSDFNLGIATQTDIGLVVPVLKKAQTLSVWKMAEELNRLAEGARNNKLKPEEMGGATTTLTSLGPLGGIVTTPVINRPEVAIIGPNRIIERPMYVTGSDGAERIEKRKLMNISISCDHRVVDGWDAASFVQALKKLLEAPALILVS
jgi:2-oxoisovalerate dehydrogenase E2 component (dihydrolipoyl transacylase)